MRNSIPLMNMKHTYLIRRALALVLVMLSAACMPVMALYTVHAVSGKVSVKSAGKVVNVKPGMEVKANDMLTVPSGGQVKILNHQDKKIYSSVKAGQFTVMTLMIDAKGVADSNTGTVMRTARFAKSSDTARAQKVYSEKGVVRRALTSVDADGNAIAMDAATLGGILASRVKDGNVEDDVLPVTVEHESSVDCGLKLGICNTLEYPIYFNVICLTGNPESPLDYSVIGQAKGNYLLLPQQSLTKEHLPELPDGEKQILIMSHSDFDVAKVIEEANRQISAPDASNNASAHDPVFIMEL